MDKRRYEIETGDTALGMEFGSTRIKAILLNRDHQILAAGTYEWENQLTDGIWSYSLEEIIKGMQGCYADLKRDIKEKYNMTLHRIGAMGISAMQHGYMVFDQEEHLLVPFRTWRNTITGEASKELTELFRFPIPQRWSVAHLYQAMLNREEHVKEICSLTTLAVYVHWKLTGNRVAGLNEASGMFPVNSDTLQYNSGMEAVFNKLVHDAGYHWDIRQILPDIVPVGESAGELTEAGAGLLDPAGDLQAGVPFCPPEGDGATGMISTNSIRPGTGNLSAGTSAFAMIVLKKKLSGVYSEIDQVVTPEGYQVGMVHCNNCTSDLNAWVQIFREFSQLCGIQMNTSDLYRVLYQSALEGDTDCGGLMAYNHFSGEHILGITEGRPMLIRTPDSRFHLSNFMRVNLYSAVAAVKIGMDILLKEEHVQVDEMIGHGGFFKTKEAAQKIVADMLQVPVTVLETAGEGGAWGMAILASYMAYKREQESLSDYLKNSVFTVQNGTTVYPEVQSAVQIEEFMDAYKRGLKVEETAIRLL